MRREFVCVRHAISKLEPITGRKSKTAIPRNIDGSRIGKTIRRSRYRTGAIGFLGLFLVDQRAVPSVSTYCMVGRSVSQTITKSVCHTLFSRAVSLCTQSHCRSVVVVSQSFTLSVRWSIILPPSQQ